MGVDDRQCSDGEPRAEDHGAIDGTSRSREGTGRREDETTGERGTGPATAGADGEDADGTPATAGTDGRRPDRREAAGPRRRRLLQTIGAAALTTALGGCQTNPEGTTTTGETPTTTTPTTTAAGDGGDGGDAGTGGDGTETTTTTTATDSGSTPAGVEPCLATRDRAPGPDCKAPKKLDFNVTEDRTIGGSCNQYVVDRDVAVRDGATLRVEPGTLVRFEEGTSIEVGETGSLVAAGTCEDPVAFTGTADGRGHWGGIAFHGATGNRLQYCVVEGGGREFTNLVDERAAVVAGQGATLSVENCTLRTSSGYGIALGDDATLTGFRNNALTDNRAGAASAHPATVRAFRPENSYEGNDVDVIAVAPGAPVPDGSSHTWTDNGLPYRVLGEAVVEGDLTVAAGTVVTFSAGAGLGVQGGTLSVPGSSDAPVRFSGVEDERGYWRGIHLNGVGEDGATLANCIVEYAGGAPAPGVGEPVNLSVTGESTVSLETVILRQSRGYGLGLGEGTELSTFADCELTRNRAGAAVLPSPVVPSLTAESTYDGNATDVVDVTVTRPIPDPGTTTWPGIDATYRVRGDLAVEGTLVLDPGASLAFTPRSSLRVNGGRLLAEGTRSAPVTLTGARQQPGIWQGLLFQGSGGGESRLENCVVAFGGGEPFPDADQPANLSALNGAKVAVRNVVFRRSNGYGLTLREGARFTAFENNVVTDNATGAAYVRMRAVGQLDASSTFADNDVDRVQVVAGERVPAGERDTWPGIDVPYRVDGDVTIRGTLAIDPGATLEMVEDAGILARSGGSLNAVGTADERIRIVGTDDRQGHWQGIYFENTGQGTNEIRHCLVAHGGGRKFVHAAVPANVAVTTSSFAAVTDCDIESSGGYGIHATRGTTLELDDNTFRYNDLGATKIER